MMWVGENYPGWEAPNKAKQIVSVGRTALFVHEIQLLSHTTGCCWSHLHYHCIHIHVPVKQGHVHIPTAVCWARSNSTAAVTTRTDGSAVAGMCQMCGSNDQAAYAFPHSAAAQLQPSCCHSEQCQASQPTWGCMLHCLHTGFGHGQAGPWHGEAVLGAASPQSWPFSRRHGWSLHVSCIGGRGQVAARQGCQARPRPAGEQAVWL